MIWQQMVGGVCVVGFLRMKFVYFVNNSSDVMSTSAADIMHSLIYHG